MGLVAVLVCPPPARAATAFMLVSPSSLTVNTGQTFSLDIDINSVTDLYDFQFDLSFNPSLLHANSVSQGPFLPSGGSTFFIAGIINNLGGTINGTADSLIGLIPGVSGSGVLASISFTALLPLGTSAITLSNTLADDSHGFPIFLGDPANGSVTILAVAEPPTLTLMAFGLLLALWLGWRLGHCDCRASAGYCLKNFTMRSEVPSG